MPAAKQVEAPVEPAVPKTELQELQIKATQATDEVIYHFISKLKLNRKKIYIPFFIFLIL